MEDIVLKNIRRIIDGFSFIKLFLYNRKDNVALITQGYESNCGVTHNRAK